jgi:VanZ family protein
MDGMVILWNRSVNYDNLSVMSFRTGWLILFILAALGILIFSLMPDPPNVGHEQIDDQFLHFLAYGVLGFLGIQSIIFRILNLKNLLIIISVMLIALIAYGGFIELMQRYTGRHTDITDLAADFWGSAAGILAGFFIRWAVRSLRHQKND